ncbi:CDP-diacylglycerol--serine O-phosphatidyltransferase [Candidatus Woesearchaeota archaeon]|nr:CDP-diacylglycerol--serine O-phosphatidyltransferase [Candidatus Woesearchaeota archaeon]
MRLKIKKEKIITAFTLLRVILAFIVSILIISGKENIATVFFIITALITFLEGLTNKHIEKSLLKSILNFFADRFLINIVAIALVLKNLLPPWVVLVFILRDLLTIIIGFIMFYRDSRREFKPTALGKLSLFFQIIALIPAMIGTLDQVLIWLAIVMTSASGIEALFKSEFRLVKRRTALDEFKIFRLIKFADVFTLTNVIFGIISILFAIKGWYNTASFVLILAVISDYFDGKIAKIMAQQNEFGKELDSLADTISFGVAPAIFGFSLIQTPLAIICFTIFLFCGILRLARYNIMNLKGAFQGMPITLNGIVIPFAYLLRNVVNIEIKFFPYLYLILGVLMISSFRIKRLH